MRNKMNLIEEIIFDLNSIKNYIEAGSMSKKALMQEIEETMIKVQVFSEGEYKILRQCEEKLCALESHGVDNWCGYSDAMSEFYKEEGEE